MNEISTPLEGKTWTELVELQEQVAEHLDGANLIKVLLICADHLDLDFDEFIENSRMARDLINGTQSNAKQAWNTVREWARIDVVLSTPPDGIPDLEF